MIVNAPTFVKVLVLSTEIYLDASTLLRLKLQAHRSRLDRYPFFRAQDYEICRNQINVSDLLRQRSWREWIGGTYFWDQSKRGIQ